MNLPFFFFTMSKKSDTGPLQPVTIPFPCSMPAIHKTVSHGSFANAVVAWVAKATANNEALIIFFINKSLCFAVNKFVDFITAIISATYAIAVKLRFGGLC